MSAFVDAVALLLGVLVLAPALVFGLQVLLGVRQAGRQRPPAPRGGARPRLAVLMPAHNEALGIAATLASVRPQLRPGDRLLVVADNCSDDTAGVARAAGASVAERHDPLRRGKGYALAFGLAELAAAPVEVVVMVDADCVLGAGCIDELVRASALRGRPVQALYLMRAPPGAGPGQRLAEFAWRVKNEVRPLGAGVLGWPCLLTGSGMAFPWHSLSGVSMASGNIVEDMQLGIDLALRGHPPEFAPAALVLSSFPADAAAERAQRQRWEHGHLGTLLRQAPALLSAALQRRDARLIGLALDLCVPPLALLVLATAAVFIGALLWRLLGGSGIGAWLAGLALLAIVAGVMTAWAARGRDLLSARDLARAPWYALRKLPLYLRFAIRRQSAWVRAKRDGE